MRGTLFISLLFFLALPSGRALAENFTFGQPLRGPATPVTPPKRERFVIHESSRTVEKDMRVKEADKMVATARDEFDRMQSWKRRTDRSPASEGMQGCLSPYLATAERVQSEMTELQGKVRGFLGVRNFPAAEGALDFLKQKAKDLSDAENEAMACIGDDPDVPDSL